MLSKLSYLISNFALTLGYLNPTLNNPAQSYNPTSHKATTIRTLTRRAQLVCDSPDSLQDETDYLNNVFSKNNYNTDFVRRNTHSNTYSNTQPNVHSGPVTKATIIPYIRSTFETIACILQPYNIRVAHKPITTIRRLLTNVRDKDRGKTGSSIQDQMLRLPGFLHGLYCPLDLPIGLCIQWG